jgi:hypothetical protein
MHAREKKEQESEWQRDEFFNKLQTMAPWQQWRAKVVSEALKETRVKATEEQEVASIEMPVKTESNRSDWPTTLVGPVEEGYAHDRSDRPVTVVKLVNETLIQIGTGVLAPSQSFSEVPAPVDDEDEMLDFEPSSVWEDIDVNAIYLSSMDYSLVGYDEVVKMSVGPCDVVFQRLKDSENHLKSLYIQGHLDSTPIFRMLINGEAIINLMSYSFVKKMGKSDEELIKTSMMINGVGGGDPIGAKGVDSSSCSPRSAFERVCWLFCLELSRNVRFKPWSSRASASHQSRF